VCQALRAKVVRRLACYDMMMPISDMESQQLNYQGTYPALRGRPQCIEIWQ